MKIVTVFMNIILYDYLLLPSYYIKERYWYIYYISVPLFFGLTSYDFYPQTNYNSPGLSKKRVTLRSRRCLD